MTEKIMAARGGSGGKNKGRGKSTARTKPTDGETEYGAEQKSGRTTSGGDDTAGSGASDLGCNDGTSMDAGDLPPPAKKYAKKVLWRRSHDHLLGHCVNCGSGLEAKNTLVLPGSKLYVICRSCKESVPVDDMKMRLMELVQADGTVPLDSLPLKAGREREEEECGGECEEQDHNCEKETEHGGDEQSGDDEDALSTEHGGQEGHIHQPQSGHGKEHLAVVGPPPQIPRDDRGSLSDGQSVCSGDDTGSHLDDEMTDGSYRHSDDDVGEEAEEDEEDDANQQEAEGEEEDEEGSHDGEQWKDEKDGEEDQESSWVEFDDDESGMPYW
jgi:hypothetical protein